MGEPPASGTAGDIDPDGLGMLRRLLIIQQDQIRHISDLSLRLVEAHFAIRKCYADLRCEHRALVFLLQDLGVLEPCERGFGDGEFASAGSGFSQVMGTKSLACAVLIGAGLDGLVAFARASRASVGLLAALFGEALDGDLAECCQPREEEEEGAADSEGLREEAAGSEAGLAEGSEAGPQDSEVVRGCGAFSLAVRTRLARRPPPPAPEPALVPLPSRGLSIDSRQRQQRQRQQRSHLVQKAQAAALALPPGSPAAGSPAHCAEQPDSAKAAMQGAEGSDMIFAGELVRVQGLSRRPDLNGKTGIVMELIPELGRWLVMLSDGGHVRLRRENLTLTLGAEAPPPQARPTCAPGCSHDLVSEAVSALGLKLADFAGALTVSLLKVASRQLLRETRSHLELAIYGGLGDKSTGRRLDCFSPLSGGWKVCAPSHHSHYMGCTAILNGHLYICGGLTTRATRFVERVELGAGDWEDLPHMRRPRFAAAAVAIAGRLFVVGGISDDEQVLDSVESYSPSGSEWEEEPSMQHGRCLLSAMAVAGRLLVAGGLRTMQARSGERLPVSSCVGEVFLRPGHLEGGSRSSSWSCFHRTLEVLSPQGRQWKECPGGGRLRYEAASASFRGLYVACGGFDDMESGCQRAVDAFDPRLGSWRSLAPMVHPRAAATAIAIDSAGMLLVAGGHDGKAALESVEGFSLERGCWEVVCSLSFARVRPMVNVIGDRAFVCGGSGEEAGEIEGLDLRTFARFRVPGVPSKRADCMAFVVPA